MRQLTNDRNDEKTEEKFQELCFHVLQLVLYNNMQIVALLFLCSQLQMLQFLDSLLAYLPASCSIQHVKSTGGQGAAHIFSLALEKEVVSLRECVSSLLCEEEEEEQKKKSLGLEETSDPGSVQGLQRCREAWQRDVEWSRMRLSPLVDVGRYRRLTQSMSRVQLDCDLAALLDSQRTLLG